MRRIAIVSTAAIALALLAVLTLSPLGATGGPPTQPSAQSAPPVSVVPGEVLIQYAPGASSADKAKARALVGAARIEGLIKSADQIARTGELELARVPAGLTISAAVRKLETDPDVLFAEANQVFTHQAVSTDPFYTNGSLWGMYGDGTSPANQYGSQAGEAWAAGSTGSSGVFVGVIDEGIQYTHPDLDANIWLNPFDPANGLDDDGNGYVDDMRGWDFTQNNNTIYDGGKSGNADKHGTHVSGTIGAESNGSGVVGVNWNVTLISGKFLGKNGGTLANAVKAVDYFTDLKTRHGLNIVATNNSWGGGGYSQALADAITRADNADILFVAAAGNGGNDGVGDNNDVTASYPSNYTHGNVIAVAAIASNGSKTTWSNYGLNSVDLGAPGAGIYSTLPVNKYGSYSGTSMSTPHVTGAAALYASTHPGATAAQVKSALLSTTVPTSSLSGKVLTGGRLDAAAAAALAP